MAVDYGFVKAFFVSTPIRVSLEIVRQLNTGELIDATPVNVKAKGQKTLVSIRPERVEVKAELLPADAHLIEAEVVEVTAPHSGRTTVAPLRAASCTASVACSVRRPSQPEQTGVSCPSATARRCRNCST